MDETVAGPAKPERPVFLASSERRPRALRASGRTASAAMGLWLVALLVGALGLGYLPGVPILGGQSKQHGARGGSHRAAATSLPAPPSASSARAVHGRGIGGSVAAHAPSTSGRPGVPGISVSLGRKPSSAARPPTAAVPVVSTPTPATSAPTPSGSGSSASSPAHGGTPPGTYHSAPQSATAPAHSGTVTTPRRGSGTPGRSG